MVSLWEGISLNTHTWSTYRMPSCSMPGKMAWRSIGAGSIVWVRGEGSMTINVCIHRPSPILRPGVGMDVTNRMEGDRPPYTPSRLKLRPDVWDWQDGPMTVTNLNRLTMSSHDTPVSLTLGGVAAILSLITQITFSKIVSFVFSRLWVW
jgi:hypothetical protein